MKKIISILPLLFITQSLFAQIPLSKFSTLVQTATVEKVRNEISNGADVNETNKYGWTPLMMASAYNTNAGVVSELIKAGAKVNVKNSDDQSALVWAAQYNPNPAVIKVLLNAGANLQEKNFIGYTILMYASLRNPNPEVITTLINAGANVNERDDKGKTALMSGVYNPNLDIVKTLLKAGSNINAKDLNGYTPLIHAAIGSKNPKTILYLLKIGADPKSKNKYDKTAWDYIQNNKSLKNTDAYWKLNDLRY